MAAGPRPGLFALMSTDAVRDEAEGSGLRHAVGTLDLTALGLGAVIGTGIFVIIGEAIGDSGPAIILSFLLAGVTCVFSAAAPTPTPTRSWRADRRDPRLGPDPRIRGLGRGGRRGLGRLPHRAAGLALRDLATGLDRLPPGDGGTFNVPAAFLVLAVAGVLIAGVRESARVNTAMVFVKVAVLLLFIVLGITAFDSDHLSPFAPQGLDGTVTAAALSFFACIGSTPSPRAARRPRTPRAASPSRSWPRSASQRCSTSRVDGGRRRSALRAAERDESPLATVLSKGADLSWGADLISFGA